LCKYAAAVMVKNEPIGEFKERGVLINISSVAGFEG
jgi:3-hydroxyacyl-CoA dehydrogenase